ncbi:MAG: hypothetical protein RLZZ57_464 [Pseudomonadota bacterium]|jgi:hypothetical protein
MSVQPSNSVEKLFGTIADARRAYGVSRTWVYRAARERPDLLRKIGRSTLVDFGILSGIIANLPQADIRGRY